MTATTRTVPAPLSLSTVQRRSAKLEQAVADDPAALPDPDRRPTHRAAPHRPLLRHARSVHCQAGCADARRHRICATATHSSAYGRALACALRVEGGLRPAR
jgi:hypothetical protein